MAQHLISRKRLHVAFTAFLAVAVVGLILNRLWIGFGWGAVFTAGMTYAPDLSVQYARYYDEHQAWPAPEDLFTRLQFIDSTTTDDARIDRYACGLYASYEFQLYLFDDGKTEFYCWKRQADQ